MAGISNSRKPNHTQPVQVLAPLFSKPCVPFGRIKFVKPCCRGECKFAEVDSTFHVVEIDPHEIELARQLRCDGNELLQVGRTFSFSNSGGSPIACAHKPPRGS